MDLNQYLVEDPSAWLDALPSYQRDALDQLLRQGKSYDEAAQSYLTASAANTFKFGADPSVVDKSSFLKNLRRELRAYLCGDAKYKAERDGLFGKKGVARELIVSSIAVAIAQHLNVAAVVIAPVIALLLASIGRVTLEAWCAIPLKE